MHDHQLLPSEEEEEEEQNNTQQRNYDKLIIVINPEYARIAAYVMFWLMIVFCMTLTKFFVDPDLVDHSPLIDMFGYNNICIFFDYAPARVATAMFYPFVEIPLLIYIVLNYLRLRETFYEPPRLIERWEFVLGSVFFPICFVLALYFRMVFVVEAFDDVIGHTLGFQGLQLSLALVSIQNFIYNKATNNVPFAPWISIVYLASLLLVTAIKMILVWIIFIVRFTPTPFTSIFGQFLDVAWMLLAAVVPLGIAFYQRNRTRHFKIVLGD